MGANIKIAILDSGIMYDHPEFSSNIKPGFNAIEPDRLPNDDYGHGTLMSGIIGAQHNHIGIKGLAPSAEIYPVKVLDKFGEGRITDVVNGISWCIDHDIDIMNMSFAIDHSNAELESMIKKAVSKGIIIVASVSNSNGGTAGYPASYDEVLSVTPVNESLRIGKTAARAHVDFSAPGVNVVTTNSNGEYEYVSGTSISAPYITGFIALILQDIRERDLGVTEALKRYARDLGAQGKDDVFGNGFVIYE